MNAVFTQAIQELLPHLDDGLQEEIKNKVSMHLFETLKGLVFIGRDGELSIFEDELKAITDDQQKATIYVERLVKEYEGLSQEIREDTNKKLDIELTQVMHQLHQSAK